MSDLVRAGAVVTCDCCHRSLTLDEAEEALVWGGLCYTCWLAAWQAHRTPGSRTVAMSDIADWPRTVDEVELE